MAACTKWSVARPATYSVVGYRSRVVIVDIRGEEVASMEQLHDRDSLVGKREDGLACSGGIRYVRTVTDVVPDWSGMARAGHIFGRPS